MLYIVQQFINSLTDFLLREDYFPLTLTLSPIGGEGKKWNRFNALWLLNPATSFTPSPPASGGEGWGEGGDIWAARIYEILYLGRIAAPRLNLYGGGDSAVDPRETSRKSRTFFTRSMGRKGLGMKC